MVKKTTNKQKKNRNELQVRLTINGYLKYHYATDSHNFFKGEQFTSLIINIKFFPPFFFIHHCITGGISHFNYYKFSLWSRSSWSRFSISAMFIFWTSRGSLGSLFLWKIKIWIGLSFDTTWDVITRVFPRFKQFACFPEEFPLVFLILFMK